MLRVCTWMIVASGNIVGTWRIGNRGWRRGGARRGVIRGEGGCGETRNERRAFGLEGECTVVKFKMTRVCWGGGVTWSILYP